MKKEMRAAHSMHLYLEAFQSDIVTRQCRIERRNAAQTTSSEVLWYSMPMSEGLPPEEDGEPFLLACMLQAMAEKRSLFVHGSASRELLSNLTEFRNAWHCWRPDDY